MRALVKGSIIEYTYIYSFGKIPRQRCRLTTTLAYQIVGQHEHDVRSSCRSSSTAVATDHPRCGGQHENRDAVHTCDTFASTDYGFCEIFTTNRNGIKKRFERIRNSVGLYGAKRRTTTVVKRSYSKRCVFARVRTKIKIKNAVDDCVDTTDERKRFSRPRGRRICWRGFMGENNSF